MGNEVIQLTVMALALVFGGACEELLPNFLGVGFPVLLASAQYFSSSRTVTPLALLFALSAGAMEDALSSLPAMTGVGFFLLTAVAGRWARLPQGAMLLTYPVFQVWLYLFLGEAMQGGIFNRLLLALPIGLATECAVWPVLAWMERKAAIDGRK